MTDNFATKADLTSAIHESESRLLERLEKLETTLLQEFHKWAQITEARIRVTEVVGFGLSDRVASLETRVRALEQS